MCIDTDKEQVSWLIVFGSLHHCISSLSERDAFDTLFDHAPDKLNVVKRVGIPYVFLSDLCYAFLICPAYIIEIFDK